MILLQYNPKTKEYTIMPSPIGDPFTYYGFPNIKQAFKWIRDRYPNGVEIEFKPMRLNG